LGSALAHDDAWTSYGIPTIELRYCGNDNVKIDQDNKITWNRWATDRSPSSVRRNSSRKKWCNETSQSDRQDAKLASIAGGDGHADLRPFHSISPLERKGEREGSTFRHLASSLSSSGTKRNQKIKRRDSVIPNGMGYDKISSMTLVLVARGNGQKRTQHNVHKNNQNPMY